MQRKQFTLILPEANDNREWFDIELLQVGINLQQYVEYVLGKVCWIIFRKV